MAFISVYERNQWRSFGSSDITFGSSLLEVRLLNSY